MTDCDYCDGDGAYLAYNGQPSDCWKCEGTGKMREGDTRKSWIEDYQPPTKEKSSKGQ